MGKLIIAVVILVLGIVGWRFLGSFSTKALSARDQSMATWLKVVSRAALVAGIGIPVLIFTFSVFRVIPAGHVGVKVLFGQTDPHPLREGLNVVWNPLYEVVIMDTRVTKHEVKYDAGSKDLQAVHVKMALNYRLMPDGAPEVYRTVGLDYARVILDPAAQEVLKAHTATHNAAEILQKRPLIKGDVQGDLTVWLAKYKIELKEVSLADVDFDKNYRVAIEAKQIEEQKAEQKRYELVQAQRQAEIVQASAKGAADAAREEAKGMADALRTKGSAQAEYNSKVSASLTPQLIAQQWIEAWKNGGSQVPTLVSGGQSGGGFLLQVPLPDLKKQTEK